MGWTRRKPAANHYVPSWRNESPFSAGTLQSYEQILEDRTLTKKRRCANDSSLLADPNRFDFARRVSRHEWTQKIKLNVKYPSWVKQAFKFNEYFGLKTHCRFTQSGWDAMYETQWNNRLSHCLCGTKKRLGWIEPKRLSWREVTISAGASQFLKWHGSCES